MICKPSTEDKQEHQLHQHVQQAEQEVLDQEQENETMMKIL